MARNLLDRPGQLPAGEPQSAALVASAAEFLLEGMHLAGQIGKRRGGRRRRSSGRRVFPSPSPYNVVWLRLRCGKWVI